MGPDEMAEIAELIAVVLRRVDDDAVASDVKERAARLCSKFEPYPGLV
jgi:glycine/serine hydroxymethyltransferase